MTCPVCQQSISGRGWQVPVPAVLSLAASPWLVPASAPVEAIQVCSSDCANALSRWMELQRDWQDGLYPADRFALKHKGD